MDRKNNIYGIIVVILFILIIIGGIFTVNAIMDDDKNKPQIQITQQVEHNDKSSINASTKEQLIKEQTTIINDKQKEIKSYKIQSTKTATDITGEVSKFKHFANDIENIKQQISSTPLLSDDESITKKLETLTLSLSNVQSVNFPQLRTAYAKAASHTMIKDNIVVEAIGKNNTILEIIGERYADTNNISVDFNILSTQLTNLRFKSIRFKTEKDALPTATRSISNISDKEIGLY